MRIGIAILLVLACAAAAQERRAYSPAITVTALRDPVDKSYRKMIRGVELFEQMRVIAPEASLRYKLLPRKPDTSLEGIELTVDANSFAIPVAVSPDRTFTLERNQKALDEDASVTSNRKALSMTWRAEIRTPGLPPGTRRLGDLRLECHVGMEADLVSNVRELRTFFGPITNARLRERGFCDRSDARYLYFAERPLFRVTLVSGVRREALPLDRLYAGLSRGDISKDELAYCDCEVLLDRAYFLPLGDRSWPDDTLVEFEYMDAPAAGTDDPRAAITQARLRHEFR
jgi:hypothetical protein